MKALIFLFVLFLLFAPACNTEQREKALQLKETELNRREQELLVREKSLQLKEEELLNREHLFDSALKGNVADTLAALYPTLSGLYNVTMKCTETTCTGSAVGDTKNEQWEISVENNTVLVKAMSDKKLVRVYKGNFVGKSIELLAQHNTTAAQAGTMLVRLQQTKENEWDGIREITRPENCRIIYDLDLQKQ